MVFGRRRDRTATTRGGGRKRSGIYRMVLFLLGLLLLPGLGIWIAGWLVRHLNQDTQEDLVTPTILGVRNNGADIFYFIVGILLFLITILSLWLAALLTGITGRRFFIFLGLMAGLLLFSMLTQVMYYVIGGIDANCSTLRSETLGIAPDALCAGDKILFTSSVWTLFFLSIALPVLLLYLFHILKQHLKRKFTETRYTRTVAATPVTRERERERERTAVRGVTAEDTTTRANRV
ncbi:hypothetical protein QOT17_021998 [Balamuthia mandrillaris]